MSRIASYLPGSVWANTCLSASSVFSPPKAQLARLVDSDGGCDDAENGYFESANDPQLVQEETEQRHFRGQLRRRPRHLESKARRKPDGPRQRRRPRGI